MKQVFVIQHPNLAALPLVQTARHFRLPERIAGSSLRLAVAADAAIPTEVTAELDAAGAEYALLADTAFADLGLIVSDMDSTLITIECIDEIAAAAGLKEQVAAVTERAMRGEMDFEDSLRERVALLAGLPESVLDDVYEHALRLSPGAEYLLAECKKHQVKFLLVSGGFTFFTERLKERLGLDWAYANTLETAGGKLTGRVVGPIIDAQAKARLLEEHRLALGLERHQVAAVGDGANDIPMLQAAGFGIAYHAKPKTRAQAALNIRHMGLEALRGWFA